MNAKISVFVICTETIIHWLSYNLNDCNFNRSRNIVVPLETHGRE